MGNKSSRASEGGGHGKAGVKHKIKKLKKSVIKHRLESAKKLGTLQLVGGGLTALPKEVGKSLLHVCMQCVRLLLWCGAHQGLRMPAVVARPRCEHQSA